MQGYYLQSDNLGKAQQLSEWEDRLQRDELQSDSFAVGLQLSEWEAHFMISQLYVLFNILHIYYVLSSPHLLRYFLIVPALVKVLEACWWLGAF